MSSTLFSKRIRASKNLNVVRHIITVCEQSQFCCKIDGDLSGIRYDCIVCINLYFTQIANEAPDAFMNLQEESIYYIFLAKETLKCN